MSAEDPNPPPWASPGHAPPPAADPSAEARWTSAEPSSWSAPAPPAAPPPPNGWWPNAIPQAPRPGLIPLRPLGVGELLDGAFTMIRRYPAATLGLAAAVMLVVEVIQILTSYYFLHGIHTTTLASGDTVNTGVGDVAARVSTVGIVTAVVTLVASSLLAGMISAVVGRGALGRPMSASEAWAATRTCFWRLVGATLLIFLIGLGIVAVGVVPGVIVIVAGATVPGIILLVVGSIGAVVYAFYVVISLSFTTPALMLEQIGIRTAMSRSRALVKTSWWRVFGILLLAGIIAEVLAGAIGTPFQLAGGTGIFSTHGANQYRSTALLLTGIGTLIGATLVRPFSAGLTALLYLDRRMRAEGLDLSLQQAASTPQP